jgi:dolichyl-phosphooligosaccharide-protein glycotransferase
MVKVVRKKMLNKKSLFIGISLVSIFFLVLFFNSYFNYTAGTAFNSEGTTLGTRFFLAGPDPYYNMRLCQETLKTGHYPFVLLTDGDPLLNYPVGILAGARPPLFNFVALGTVQLLSPIMNQMDALGWVMLFMSAIYGALLIFPVYGIGKELFNYKVGLIAGLLVPLIPIHIGAGHGSAFSLFDHDSFILLLTTILFYFVIKAYKEKDTTRTILYSLLGGVVIGAIHLTWSASQVTYLMVTLFGLIMLFVDIYKCKYSLKHTGIPLIVVGTGFLIALPYSIIIQELPNFPLYTSIVALGLFIFYFVIKKINMSWVISIPFVSGLFGAGLFILYLVREGTIYLGGPIINIAEVIYGKGIYGQKISLTIAEAHTFGLSQTVMSFGPAVYWLGLIGFCIFLYKIYKEKLVSYQMFFVMIFVINFWLTTTAGRFLNDLLPQMVVFAGLTIYLVIEKVNYKDMVRKMKSLSGIHKLTKGVRIYHVFGVLFIVFLIMIPNSFLALDAGVPPELKGKVFGTNYTGYWGTSLYEQVLWSDALYWLSQQDTEIPLPQDRPGFLSWWDYGFYEVSMGEHPAVADNYQEGFYAASNFLTSQNESEAIAILTIRLAEGTKKPVYAQPGKDNVSQFFIAPETNVSAEVEQVFREFFPEQGNNIILYMNNPEKCPSYNSLIAPEYGNTIGRVNRWNAMYHDIIKIILTLSSENELKLYDAMSTATGYDIRYVGLESRDISDIFGVFPFLADKGTHGYYTGEDDFFRNVYTSKDTGMQFNTSQLQSMTQEEIQHLNLTSSVEPKSGFYNSMAYRMFFGVNQEGLSNTKRYPTYGMTHFYPKYLSPYITIAKFYEGARITGSVNLNGSQIYGSIPYAYCSVVVLDEFSIPHDATYADNNGTFSLLVPAGNVSFAVVRDDVIVYRMFLSQPITEKQAMRKEPCNISIPVEINYSSLLLTVSNVVEPDMKMIISCPSFNIEQPIENLTNTVYSFPDMMPPASYNFIIFNSTGVQKQTSTNFLYPGANYINLTIG